MKKTKVHIPCEQFGFIEREYDDTWTNEKIIAEYYELKLMYKSATTVSKAPKGDKPTKLGETMKEGNNTYEAVCNGVDKKLYWLIKTD